MFVEVLLFIKAYITNCAVKGSVDCFLMEFQIACKITRLPEAFLAMRAAMFHGVCQQMILIGATCSKSLLALAKSVLLLFMDFSYVLG